MVFLEACESIELVSLVMPSIMGTQEHAQFFACVQADIALFVESHRLSERTQWKTVIFQRDSENLRIIVLLCSEV